VPFTILVVDDDAGFRRVARRLLTRRGFRVIADVATGAAAIEAVHGHRPDGVLLDVHLPDRDGLAVTRVLTSLSGAPVVVLTSTDAFVASAAALAACGARAFVTKERLVEANLSGLFCTVPAAAPQDPHTDDRGPTSPG
jgi:two-component system nitrate/nitrite response regulator NarL